MTARRVIPPFPAQLDGLSPSRRADTYSDWLAAGAAGLLAGTAAVDLLAEHGTWLENAAFTSRYIDIADDVPGAPDGIVAGVRWRAAIAGLHRQPASPAEKTVLRIAASLAAGIPVSLHDCLASLDQATLRAVLRAVAHACRGPAGTDLIRDDAQPDQDPPF